MEENVRSVHREKHKGAKVISKTSATRFSSIASTPVTKRNLKFFDKLMILIIYNLFLELKYLQHCNYIENKLLLY